MAKKSTPIVENLPDDTEQLKQIVCELISHLEEKDGQLEDLRGQLQLLLRARYGRKAESIDAGQLLLFGQQPTAEPIEESVEPAAEEKVATGQHGRKKPARELPRTRIIYELAGSELCCPECGDKRSKIGEEISEQYDYVPASVRVIEHVRCKYACGKCQGNVETAQGAIKPIEKGLAAAGMLAYIATSKFADHLPLHRLESIFKRQGATISRSTMCDWLSSTVSLLEPLYERMKARVLDSRIVWTDDTPVNMQDREHERNMREARIWVYIGDEKNPFTVFDFTPSRKRDGPKNFLGDFAGYLQADAFAGYDCIYAGGNVREVACMAHARRKFYDAQTSSKRSSLEAQSLIQSLYAIEKRAALLSHDERRRVRQVEAKPVLDKFRAWLQEQRLYSLPKSPIGKAVGYALNNWTALCEYLTDGELTIDNNRSERAIRGIAIGRKNWLFAGSQDGGHNAAVLSSFIATCKQHKVNPQEYLRDVLTRLGRSEMVDLDRLLPGTWTPATL